MEASLSSLIWYVSVMLLAVGFAYIGEHKKSVFKRRFYIGTAFLIILLFCSCRYYVGNDYGNYVYAFTRYRDWGNYSIFEPGFDFLYFLFGSSPIGYLWVFAIAACITYIFVFKALIREQSVAWGVYFLFTLGFVTCANDQIRQGIAIAIFLYATKFIQTGEFKKYFCCIAIAFLFHYSALVLIFAYLIRYIRFSGKIWVALVVITYILQLLGFWQDYVVRLILLIPYYGQIYAESLRFLIAEETSSGLGVLFIFCLALCIAITYNKLQRPVIATIYLCGALLQMVSIGFMAIERVSYYMVFINILVFPLLLKCRKVRYIGIGVVVVSFLYYYLQSYYGLEKHGAVPYRTFFNEHIEEPLSTEYYQE